MVFGFPLGKKYLLKNMYKSQKSKYSYTRPLPLKLNLFGILMWFLQVPHRSPFPRLLQ